MTGSELARLQAGASQIGVPLGEGQAGQLLAYLALLAKWNRVYNLTAVREPAEMLTQHLLDSLSIVPPLRRHTGGRAARLLDVGSGGGLPGVVLAVVMPELDVTCVDAVAKKTTFIKQVALELKLPNLRAAHSRVEALEAGAFDVVVSRAFASLDDFTRLTQHHLAPGGVWLAMKGKHPGDEIAALPADLNLFHVEQLAVPGLAAERCALWIRPSQETH